MAGRIYWGIDAGNWGETATAELYFDDLAINTNFIAFSHFYSENAGEVFVFFILTVAAAEAAIGLALVMLLYRNRTTINVNQMNHLKG